MALNGNEAEVDFLDFKHILRYRGADSFWDSNSHQSCRLVSHYDVSGGASIALVCPKCGISQRHVCAECPRPFSFDWQPGERLSVTYAPEPGIADGTYVGWVVRAAGRVARIRLDYQDGDSETVHIAHEPAGTWLDLNYGVTCEVETCN